MRLKILDFDASGIYSCEVTLETPIYTKASEDEEVTVISKFKINFKLFQIKFKAFLYF